MVCSCIARNVVKLMPLTDPSHPSERGCKSSINTRVVLRHDVTLFVGKSSCHGGGAYRSGCTIQTSSEDVSSVQVDLSDRSFMLSDR
jgi:hypothetical protein